MRVMHVLRTPRRWEPAIQQLCTTASLVAISRCCGPGSAITGWPRTRRDVRTQIIPEAVLPSPAMPATKDTAREMVAWGPRAARCTPPRSLWATSRRWQSICALSSGTWVARSQRPSHGARGAAAASTAALQLLARESAVASQALSQPRLEPIKLRPAYASTCMCVVPGDSPPELSRTSCRRHSLRAQRTSRRSCQKCCLQHPSKHRHQQGCRQVGGRCTSHHRGPPAGALQPTAAGTGRQTAQRITSAAVPEHHEAGQRHPCVDRCVRRVALSAADPARRRVRSCRAACSLRTQQAVQGPTPGLVMVCCSCLMVCTRRIADAGRNLWSTAGAAAGAGAKVRRSDRLPSGLQTAQKNIPEKLRWWELRLWSVQGFCCERTLPARNLVRLRCAQSVSITFAWRSKM